MKMEGSIALKIIYSAEKLFLNKGYSKIVKSDEVCAQKNPYGLMIGCRTFCATR